MMMVMHAPVEMASMSHEEKAISYEFLERYSPNITIDDGGWEKLFPCKQTPDPTRTYFRYDFRVSRIHSLKSFELDRPAARVAPFDKERELIVTPSQHIILYRLDVENHGQRDSYFAIGTYDPGHLTRQFGATFLHCSPRDLLRTVLLRWQWIICWSCMIRCRT